MGAGYGDRVWGMIWGQGMGAEYGMGAGYGHGGRVWG